MTEPGDWRADRVRSADAGRNPTVLAELEASCAVIGDVQFLPGCSLALTRTPGVDRLTDLPRSERLSFLADVDLLAEAVEVVVDAATRRTGGSTSRSSASPTRSARPTTGSGPT